MIELVVNQGGAFAAIDFETADYARDSACAVGIVRVEYGRIVERVYRLIRPPRREFVFTYLHGITWEMVRSEPVFGQRWPELKPLLRGLDFLAAHNASFDRGVLEACCRQAGLSVPRLPFQCTVRLAREVFGVYPTRLPDVCRALRLNLDRRHHAQADAEACARIVLAARKAVSRRAD